MVIGATPRSRLAPAFSAPARSWSAPVIPATVLPDGTNAGRCRCASNSGVPIATSNGIRTAFAGSHPDQRLDRRHPDLAVADLAGACGADDGRDHDVYVFVIHDDVDACLRNEVDLVLGTPVYLGVPLLPPVALGFGVGHAVHAGPIERGADFRDRERLDDGGNQLHVIRLSVRLAAR